ncbi:MAG: hypothetical protein RIK87_05005 [Fuerstiella sp.]
MNRLIPFPCSGPAAGCCLMMAMLIAPASADERRSDAPASQQLIISQFTKSTSRQRALSVSDSNRPDSSRIGLESEADDSDAGDTELAGDRSGPAASQAGMIPTILQRRLSEVSLRDAVTPFSVDGETLREPQDAAQEFYSEAGTVVDSTFSHATPRPQRNLYPICHHPLYFEDPNMERCGRGFGVLTEAVSAVRFFGRVPLVPYMMGAQPPGCCVRALPDCPSCHRFGCDAYVPDPSLRAVGLEEAAAVGLIFLIP